MVRNTYHNLVHQLSETLDSWWRMDKYVADAEKDDELELVEFWKEYKSTLEKQIRMLKEKLKDESSGE